MIFSEPLLRAVLEQQKTVTRRPVKTDRECEYKPGRTYAVQPPIEEGPGKGRGAKSIARIRIISVEREELGRIERREARREGLPDAAAFLRYWRKLYGHVDPEQLVWRIEFELLGREV